MNTLLAGPEDRPMDDNFDWDELDPYPGDEDDEDEDEEDRLPRGVPL